MLLSPLIHSLGIIIGSVKKEFFLLLGFVFEQPVGGSFDEGRFVLSANLHGKKPGGRSGIIGVPPRLVSETGYLPQWFTSFIQGGPVGSPQIADRFLDGRRGNFEPGIFGRAQSH